MRTYYPKTNEKTGYPTGTLCNWCLHSVPNGRDRGCVWSNFLKPVEGWIATAVHRPQVFTRSSDTFCVHECPQFYEEVAR